MGLKELEQANPDFIVMICNTIHLFYNILQNKIKMPIIDLKEELKNYLRKNKIKSTLVIGTPLTIKRGLYKFDGIDYIVPSEEERGILADSINKFNRGYDKANQAQRVRKICSKYLDKKAETLILGCTEFAVMLKDENFSKINTIDILVESVISRIRNHIRGRSITAVRLAPAQLVRVQFSTSPSKGGIQ